MSAAIGRGGGGGGERGRVFANTYMHARGMYVPVWTQIHHVLRLLEISRHQFDGSNPCTSCYSLCGQEPGRTLDALCRTGPSRFGPSCACTRQLCPRLCSLCAPSSGRTCRHVEYTRTGTPTLKGMHNTEAEPRSTTERPGSAARPSTVRHSTAQWQGPAAGRSPARHGAAQHSTATAQRSTATARHGTAQHSNRPYSSQMSSSHRTPWGKCSNFCPYFLHKPTEMVRAIPPK